MLQDPKKRDLYDRGGDPLGGGMGGFNGGFGPGGFDFTNLVDAMFGQQTSRGPGRGCAAVRTRWFASILSLPKRPSGPQAAARRYRRALSALQWFRVHRRAPGRPDVRHATDRAT